MGLFTRKKKQRQDEFLKLFADAMKDANENAQNIRNTIFNCQMPNREDFGHCETNPIFTDSLAGTESYLGRLCTKDGKKFTWSNRKSIRATVHGYEDVGEDVYTLYLNGEKHTDLYFVLYVGESKFPPAKLYFCDDVTDWDLEREAFEKGVSSEYLIELRRLEEEMKNARIKEQSEFEQALAQKSTHVSSKYAGFSIKNELKNPDFVFLARLDIDILTVYEYCHKEELLFKKAVEGICDIENLNVEAYFNIMNDIENKELQHYRQNNNKSDAELQKEAASRGIKFEDLLAVRRMEEKNAEIKRRMHYKELSTLAKEALEVQGNYSEFNLNEEWKNHTFRKIADKLGMLTAYEVIHFNECYLQAQKSEPVSHQKNDETIRLFCRKCGSELVSDSAFCHRCGTEVITK